MFSVFSSLSSTITQKISLAGLQPMTTADTFTLTNSGSFKFGSASRDNCIACSDDGKYILVGANFETTTSRRLLLSSDGGTTFSRIDGTSNLPGGVQYYSHAISDNGQYQYTVCATGGTIYRSSDYGSTWTAGSANAGTTVISCDGSGTYVLANYTTGIVYSTNYGASWTSSSIYVNCVAVHISNNAGYWVFAQNNNANGIYMSTNNGSSWTVIRSVSEGIANVKATNSGTVFSVNVNTTTNPLNYYNGSSWSNIKSLTTGATIGINKTGLIIFATTTRSTLNQNVYSLDGGTTWTNGPSYGATVPCHCVVSSSGNCAYVVTYVGNVGAVYKSVA